MQDRGPEGTESVSGDTPEGDPRSWPVRWRPEDEVGGPPHRVRRGTLTGPDGREHAVASKAVAPPDRRMAEQLRGEIEILLSLWHAMQRDGPRPDRDRRYPYPEELVRLICFSERGDAPFLLTTSLPRGETLALRLKRAGWLGPEEGQRFAISLLQGLYWLQAAGIVHRDLTPENILWDGQTALILDFSHACWAGERRRPADTPPWGALDPPRDELYADVSEDVSRACLILLHLATFEPPEALAGQLHDFRENQARSAREGPDPLGGGPPTDLHITADWFPPYFFKDVFERNSRVTAGEMLDRLGRTPPAHRTRHDPPGMTAGLEQFRQVKAEKEQRRGGSVAPSPPPPDGRRERRPAGERRAREAILVVSVLLLLLVMIVGLRGL